MKLFFIMCMIAGLAFSCNEPDEPVRARLGMLEEPETSTGPLSNSNAALTATFATFAHGLSGNVSVYDLDHQQQLVRLEHFTMTAGPDVYVFVSKSNNYSLANTVAIARLGKEYNDAFLNIKIDQSVDLETYKFVLVYCVKFNSLFGFAELK